MSDPLSPDEARKSLGLALAMQAHANLEHPNPGSLACQELLVCVALCDLDVLAALIPPDQMLGAYERRWREEHGS